MPDVTRPGLGYTEHVDFDTRRIIAGEPVVIDGHTFLVQRFERDSFGRIEPPHPGSEQDAFGIVGRVTLTLDHAPWRGCPAVDPPKSEIPAEPPVGSTLTCVNGTRYERVRSAADGPSVWAWLDGSGSLLKVLSWEQVCAATGNGARIVRPAE